MSNRDIIIVNSKLIIRKHGEYLRLTCEDDRFPLFLTVHSNEQAKEHCNHFLGEGSWEIRGDTL